MRSDENRTAATVLPELGIKSDPILYRYSWEWLFALMRDLDVSYLQLGSFFEMYSLEDSWFRDLRRSAERFQVCIRSCFTAHRELGGLLSDDPRMYAVAMRNYRRFIEVAAILGADSCGSNPGAIPRDLLHRKSYGVARYQTGMMELSAYARSRGLKALTIEPMSSRAEPPTTAEEIRSMGEFFLQFHREREHDTVPVFFCGDVSHGYADQDQRVIESHMDLLAAQIPYMSEFHYKNTDDVFNSTFGFGPREVERGIVDLKEVLTLLMRSRDQWPVGTLTGYLELPGPKLGRDYTDVLLQDQMQDSIRTIQNALEALHSTG